MNQALLKSHLDSYLEAIESESISEEILIEFSASYFSVLAQERFLNESPEFSFHTLIKEFTEFLASYDDFDTNRLLEESIKEYFHTLNLLNQ